MEFVAPARSNLLVPVVKKNDLLLVSCIHSSYHPGLEAVENAIRFEVIRTFAKPLDRQVAEAVAIQACKADKLLNSKSEWEQPAVERLIVTRDLPDHEEGRRGGRRGRLRSTQ